MEEFCGIPKSQWVLIAPFVYASELGYQLFGLIILFSQLYYVVSESSHRCWTFTDVNVSFWGVFLHCCQDASTGLELYHQHSPLANR